LYKELLGTLKIGIGTAFEPAPGILGIIETNGTDGTGYIAMLTRFAARGILTQQAT
jgi:hypothetical protein